MNKLHTLKYEILDTPLGEIAAVADENNLRLLHFVVMAELQEELVGIAKKLRGGLVFGKNPITESISRELSGYFDGTLREFKTPVFLRGTAFQMEVWNHLRAIPFGQVESYAQVAKGIGNPKACRAVGSANGANPLPIIVPCHRVIASHGGLGGYSAGLDRKSWLLRHETQAINPVIPGQGRNDGEALTSACSGRAA